MAQWGIQPDSFWSMDVQEWWWIYDVKRPRDPALDNAGSLDADTVKELYDWLEAEG